MDTDYREECKLEWASLNRVLDGHDPQKVFPSRWVETVEIPSTDGAYGSRLFKVVLAPKSLDLKATPFPDGLTLGGQEFGDEEEALRYSRWMEYAMRATDAAIQERMAEPDWDSWESAPQSFPGGNCTMVYWDAAPAPHKGMHAYLRLILPCVELEKLGIAHGVSLGGEGHFASKEEAAVLAGKVDEFMLLCFPALQPVPAPAHTP